ncbi:hypothetical protein PsorP6_016663 [Peronosclerospora sorghi]|uniref:Uncharacterized protein n=1 Tax=Peronosclerospora sorghi TaxID=230839 RepID=A0ACC0VQZ6_9STRA|nr:hypothetical protein PsorP6_016663 [Peronosclerospora sorghi]
MVYNARPVTLLSHVSRCPKIPAHVRLGLGKSDRTTVTHSEVSNSEKPHKLSQNANQSEAESKVKGITVIEAPPPPTECHPMLGKRARVPEPPTSITLDTIERMVKSVTDVTNSLVELKRQDLQLRKEELEFRKEALSAKLADRQEAREEERRDRREQREADRLERVELARMENEKNLAFLKAVMESSIQQRQ